MGRIFRRNFRTAPPGTRHAHILGALLTAAIVQLTDIHFAWGYIQTVTPSGIPVHWNPGFKFNVAGNPRNQTGLSDQDFYAAVTRGLQRWQAASAGGVAFDYWQGTDARVFETNSEYNGLSSVYFASSGGGDTGISPNVLGLTQVWYNADSGEILEADTVLNDRDFTFTTNPRDTSGYGAGNPAFSSGRTQVYIENVLTHEFGHSMGLSHSAGLQSTMLFMESPEQAHLGCDEQIAIHALYPTGDAGSRGTITGTVTGPSGQALFGAHVLAVSRLRGVVLATGLTGRNGSYSISGLEPGTYYLIAEPYFAGASALPGYYSSVNEDVCGEGNPFRRTVLTDSGGYLPHAVPVGANSLAQAPVLRVGCSPMGDAFSSAHSSASISSAPPLYSSGDPSGFGVVDRFSSTHETHYSLRGVSGRVEIHAVGYSVYSPVHATLSIEDASGRQIPAEVSDHVYEGDSGYVNYDSQLVADIPAGDYYLKVSTSSLSVAYYPAGPVMLDSDPFLLITGSVNGQSPVLAGALPTNARCRMNESFSVYTSPGGDPPRSDTGDSHVGFCGTISSGGGGGSGPGPGEIAGWLLPWFLMAGLIPFRRALGRLRAGSPAATI